MAKAKKRSNDLIERIIRAEHPQCIGLPGGKLSTDRSDLKGLYLGAAYEGDSDVAAQGLSTYVDRTVLETVEWAKPGLLRVFASTGEIIRFEPVGPEDEQSATDATDYVNQIIFGRNAFSLVHDVLTDALYQRVGWAKCWWDDDPKETVIDYEGLSQEEAVALLSSMGQSAEAEKVEREEGDEGIPTFCVRIRRRKESGEIKIEPVCSENVIISSDARSVEDARFIAHWELIKAGDLVREGFGKDFVDGLPRHTGTNTTDYPETTITRNISNESGNMDSNSGSGDKSTEVIKVYEAWAWADVKGNGMPARVRARYVGEAPNITLLEWDEWPLYRPPLFAACSVPIPGNAVGLCLADLVTDLQALRTQLTRMYLDNLAMQNMGEVVANSGQAGSINYDDLLNRRPGGVYRVEGDASITPLPVGVNSAESAIAGLSMSSESIERRSGVSNRMQGIQADALQNTATGASIQEEAINQRLEMIARIFGEMFFKPLGQYVLHMLQRYQTKELQLRLKGRFLKISPISWSPDMDVIVSVGLGTGNRTKQAQTYQVILQLQQAILSQLGPQMSPVTLENVIYTCHQLVESMGLESPERFFGSVEDAKASAQAMKQQPPAPNPEQLKLQAQQQQAQAKLQLEQAKTQAQIQRDNMKAQADIALEQRKFQADMALKSQEIEAEKQLDAVHRMMGDNRPATANIREQQV